MVRLEPLLDSLDHRHDRLPIQLERSPKALFPGRGFEPDEAMHRRRGDEVAPTDQDARAVHGANVLRAEGDEVRARLGVITEQLEREDATSGVDQNRHIVLVRDLDDFLQRHCSRRTIEVSNEQNLGYVIVAERLIQLGRGAPDFD